MGIKLENSSIGFLQNKIMMMMYLFLIFLTCFPFIIMFIVDKPATLFQIINITGAFAGLIIGYLNLKRRINQNNCNTKFVRINLGKSISLYLGNFYSGVLIGLYIFLLLSGLIIDDWSAHVFIFSHILLSLSFIIVFIKHR